MTQQVTSFWSLLFRLLLKRKILSVALVFGCLGITASSLEARPEFPLLSVDTTISATICAEETYLFDGQELDESGEYKAVFVAADGSDSTVTLLLTVLPPLESSSNVSICAGETYAFFGADLDSTGQYQAVIPGSNGCDSTITLNLTVLQPSFSTLNIGICHGSYYLYEGDTLTDIGTYLYVFKAANGCDSLVRLRLNIVDYFDEELNVTICNGDTYDFGGVLLDTSGVYVDSLQAIGGCDSIVTLTLTVLPPSGSDFHVSICDGSYYIFHGDTLNATGLYVYPESSVVTGCDSLVQLFLNLVPFFEVTAQATICEGETYILGTQELSESGEYKEVFQALGGCDSTVLLQLTVLPILTGVDSATICDGETYEYHGEELFSSGVYQFIIDGSNGCDSVVTFSLTVLEVPNTVLEAVICNGDTYFFYGEQLDESGVYEHIFQAVNGCDSIITLVLTELQPIHTELNITICSGETYTFDGQVLDSSGEYSTLLQNDFGCDSLVTLNLTVLPLQSTTVEAVVCYGGSYAFDGTLITESGSYTAVFPDANGCDSTVTLQLTVLPKKETIVNATICQGSTYSFNGAMLNETGEYSAQLQGEYGCDSTVTLILSVLPTHRTDISAVICEGSAYNYYGQQLTEAGIYEFGFTGENGCDSTVVVEISVNPLQYGAMDVEICQGESFEFNGESLTQTGTYTFTFPGSNGCDSIFLVYLTVHPSWDYTYGVTLCTGQSYEFNGITLVTDGIYVAEYSTIYGCDSTVTLFLSFTNLFETTFNASICDGEKYVFDADTLTAGGTYTHVYTIAGGCDSLVTLHLEVLPSQQSELNARICQGSSYNFNGSQLTAAGDYSATLTAYNGCDSLVTLHLEVLPKLQSALEATICANESYPFNGALLDEAGVYTGVFTGSNGCDSTVTLTLSVLPTLSSSTEAVICAGEGYPFNGSTLTEAGAYTATYTASSGCDSVVTLHLQVLPVPQGGFAAIVCGDAPFEYNGQVLTQSGTYQFTLDGAAVNGCDSVVILFLTIFPAIPPTTVNASICAGDSYHIGGQELTQAGQYTFNLSSSTGCDSVVVLNLSLQPANGTAVAATFCEGGTYDFYGTILTQPGTYVHTLQNQYGCDSTITLTLLSVILPPPLIILDNGVLSTQNGLPLTYQWINCDTQQPIPGAIGNTFTPATSGNYAVVGTTPQGCSATSVCVNVQINAVGEPIDENDWNIQPNPARSRVQVAFMAPTEEDLLLEVQDAAGRLLLSQALPSGSKGVDLNLASLPAGMLIVRLHNSAGSSAKWLMKEDE